MITEFKGHKNQISFIDLLNEKKKIIIPIFQRDYAQGRPDSIFILQSFLNEIKETIETRETSKTLNLDFIYGKTEDEVFYPFDGQQRLTTLWLVLWYMNYSIESQPTLTDQLKKFAYETRTSAREFCEKLCTLEKPKGEEQPTSIKSYIKDQTWFFDEWERDPTIKAMLNALEKIEEIFQHIEKYSWFENFKKITFSCLDIDSKELPLTDDLYIKMNARGEYLSNFENFKADLVKYCSDTKVDDKRRMQIERLLDNDWADIFWQHKGNYSGRYIIDEIYFEFINRYVLNELLSDEGEIDETSRKQLGYDNNTNLRYESFDLYKKKGCEIIEKLPDILDKSKIEQIDGFWEKIPEWRRIDFIPKYEKEGSNTVKGISQSKRVVFYATCKYFEKNPSIDNEKFKDWIYFVSNMSAGIETFDAMKSAIKRIKSYAEHCNNIIEFLSGINNLDEDKGFNADQLKEEIQKSKRIKMIPSDKTKIREGEDFDFNEGSIRYLFHDCEGRENWENFDEKFETLKTYFTDWSKNSKNSEYRIRFLKIAISYCNFEQDIIYDNNYMFEDNAILFKKLFLSKKMCKSTHAILMGEELNALKEPIGTDHEKDNLQIKYLQIQYWLCNSNILENIDKKHPKCTNRSKSIDPLFYIRWHDNHLQLYPKYRELATNSIVLDAYRRDAILREAKYEPFAKDEKETRFFYLGHEIPFEYNGREYNCKLDEEHDSLEDFIKDY